MRLLLSFSTVLVLLSVQSCGAKQSQNSSSLKDEKRQGFFDFHNDRIAAERGAVRNGLPLLIHFTKSMCKYCEAMDSQVLSTFTKSPEKLVTLEIVTDIENEENSRLIEALGVKGVPCDIVVVGLDTPAPEYFLVNRGVPSLKQYQTTIAKYSGVTLATVPRQGSRN